MSTQIFINPNTCKPEFTKIAAHSFSFAPSIDDADRLYFGGSIEGFGASSLTWSKDFFNYKDLFLGLSVDPQQQALGIPLSINLVAEDVVTISGTAVFNNYRPYIDAGWNIILQVGVNYFNCKTGGNQIPSFTFIPLESFVLTNPGTVCFETSVTLGFNFDAHETRFLVGFNIIARCPDGDECSIPGGISANLSTVSYTFDIQRPCAVNTSESNFIIRNCCEPIITELVNIPGLQVGNFHVDDEGNCWKVIEASKDVTNFTRNFVNNYTSCVECQNANPCPNNLIVNSCCVEGQEFVTGSLPGLKVGDTFVDNHGLCWSVDDETAGPISEESIVVDTIIPGGCEDCTLANPCPDFWFVESCCGQFSETITTTIPLNSGDSFVDTNGICWKVAEPAQKLPTNYDIVVDTVYTGAIEPETNCDLCIAANPCPEEYFLTIRACCDPGRVEVTSLSSAIPEGDIFMDKYSICWEVMSYSTTGVTTYPLNYELIRGIYPDCETCVLTGAMRGCPALYQVRDCQTLLIYTAIALNTLNVGSFYQGVYISSVSDIKSCFEVLGYGYPQTDFLDVGIDFNSTEYTTCEECTL
jgi:hypothetical protein